MCFRSSVPTFDTSLGPERTWCPHSSNFTKKILWKWIGSNFLLPWNWLQIWHFNATHINRSSSTFTFVLNVTLLRKSLRSHLSITHSINAVWVSHSDTLIHKFIQTQGECASTGKVDYLWPTMIVFPTVANTRTACMYYVRYSSEFFPWNSFGNSVLLLAILLSMLILNTFSL